jgi:hypothetical protein
MAASVLSLLHFWFVAYFSLRRGKRSAVSKSMLAVWKLKAPEIAFAACRGPWDDRLIFPDPDKPDPPFAEGRAGPRQCAGDGHEEELSARTFGGASSRCPRLRYSAHRRIDVCVRPPADTTDQIIFTTSAATVGGRRTKFARPNVARTEAPDHRRRILVRLMKNLASRAMTVTRLCFRERSRDWNFLKRKVLICFQHTSLRQFESDPRK